MFLGGKIIKRGSIMANVNNKTYKYLLRKGYKKSDINYVKNRTPAFKTFDGKTFDGKFLYADATAVFRIREREYYLPETQIMMFRQKDEVPHKIVKWKEIVDKDFYEGIKIT